MNNTLYITVGLPGSGKSTYAKNFIKDKNVEYLSSDELRAIYGMPYMAKMRLTNQ